MGEMVRCEFYSGNVAWALDAYFRLHVVGVLTGIKLTAWPEETFLGLPRGFAQQSFAAYPANELCDRAACRREVADTVTTTQVRDDLMKVAQSFQALAEPLDTSQG